ncbi:hypothetical protein CALCODRAFT_325955 [Calocera cornea HHB12733]|uniref:Uncharacterized protein n=1 Tax=Calocera cornea HHB12733 TaxID=1353952 RepID=A0A165JG03_9BASI|nr:hypothetical protein CALCODRAFT_325955 [Calocera cornea HHB12733]
MSTRHATGPAALSACLRAASASDHSEDRSSAFQLLRRCGEIARNVWSLIDRHGGNVFGRCQSSEAPKRWCIRVLPYLFGLLPKHVLAALHLPSVIVGIMIAVAQAVKLLQRRVQEPASGM